MEKNRNFGQIIFTDIRGYFKILIYEIMRMVCSCIYLHNYAIAHCIDYHISSVIRWSFFFFQNNPKDLGLSCKTDLDLWNCLGRVKLLL